jgi:hypothetical protein
MFENFLNLWILGSIFLKIFKELAILMKELQK